MNYLITYDDALKLCDAYKNFNFHKTEHRISNYRIVTFNYFMCDYNMFIKPLREEPAINAFDMRGVTFVFNEDGTLYKRFLMLKKFFNLNQVPETQYDLLKDKKIDFITNKEDGSLIAFMKLPNGDIFAKTQGGFTNEQAIAAMELYTTQKGVRKFVNMSLNAGFTPLFEYVSYDNRIVLKYKEKELRLIGIRDNDNGQYYSAGIMHLEKNFEDMSSVKPVNYSSLDEIISSMKTSVDIEGVVIHFTDGQMVKIKTNWYFNLHGIRTMNVFREDFVIESILTETLDNVTQELSMTDDADAFKFIDRVNVAVIKWSNFIEEGVDKLVNEYNSSFYSGNWIKFATDKNKSAFFGLARTKIERPENYKKNKVSYMLNATKHLTQAKNIVDKWS